MIDKTHIQKLYNRTKALLFQPRREWGVISKEEESPKKLFNSFLFPLIAIASAGVFLGSIFQYKIIYVLLYTLTNFISLSVGIYLAYLLAREYINNKIPDAENTALYLTVYSSGIFVLFHSLSVALVSGFLSQLAGLVSLVFIRTLHAGISVSPHLENNQKTNMLIITSLSILFIPVIIKRLLMILFHIPVFNL